MSAESWLSDVDDFQVGKQGRVAGQARANRAVERDERAVVRSRQRKEVAIRELFRTLDMAKAGRKLASYRLKMVGPELVAFAADERPQKRFCRLHRKPVLREGLSCQNSNTTQLRQRTRRPDALAGRGKPRTRPFVMDVFGPKERYKHIDIQQCRAIDHGKSLSIRATSSSVIFGKPGGTSMMGHPSSAIRQVSGSPVSSPSPTPAGLSESWSAKIPSAHIRRPPKRASSKTASFSVTASNSASRRAVASTSSSTSIESIVTMLPA